MQYKSSYTRTSQQLVKYFLTTPTSNYQIDEFARLFRLPHYHQAISSDEIQNLPEVDNLTVVCNTHARDTPGVGHWVALVINSPVCNYFDSFGFSPTGFPLMRNYDIMEFLNKRHYNVTYNARDFQNINTQVCGIYAVMYIYYNAVKGYSNAKISRLLANVDTLSDDINVILDFLYSIDG